MIHLKKFTDHMKQDRDHGGSAAQSPYERCVCCHYQTEQLCRYCYEKVYSNVK